VNGSHGFKLSKNIPSPGDRQLFAIVISNICRSESGAHGVVLFFYSFSFQAIIRLIFGARKMRNEK
jgi:hypothetical protein